MHANKTCNDFHGPHSGIRADDIAAPNALHKETALAGIAAGKRVYCEKPLAPTASDAREMAEAAGAGGRKTQVGLNYLCNPMAREMITAAELGKIHGYVRIHCEDYMAGVSSPFTFRHEPAGGDGPLADSGSHAPATAEFFCCWITRVMGDCVTMIGERPDGKGGTRMIEVDDAGRAFVRFENGRPDVSRATGCHRPQDTARFEICGTKGALASSQEHFNVLHFFSTSDRRGRQGFRRIEAGSNHAPYGLFCVAAGHQLGFNDDH